MYSQAVKIHRALRAVDDIGMFDAFAYLIIGGQYEKAYMQAIEVTDGRVWQDLTNEDEDKLSNELFTRIGALLEDSYYSVFYN